MNKMHATQLPRLLTVLVAFALLATACGGSDSARDTNGQSDDSNGSSDSITLYSGRDEELIQPLIDDFAAASGIDVTVRYASSTELALLIQTEGGNSPADVFISQSPGALGLLAGEDLLVPLDDETLNKVDPGFRASDGTWVGLTGRVRTLVYNSELVEAAELPDSIFDLVDPAYAGRVGVAPTNGSFQDFVTAMRNEIGDDEAQAWLEGMAENESPNYPKNSPIVEAVGRGEIPMGLVNHYYNLRAKEADPSVPSENHFFPADDLGGLVIVTGGAVLQSSEAGSSGQELLDYLLSDEAQATFAAETKEYALTNSTNVATPEGLPSLEAFQVDTIDYELLGDGLSGTQDLIRSSGIEQ